MLISKRSRRARDRVFAGPGAGDPGDFPLRRYMRLREDFGAGAAHAALLGLLVVFVLALGRNAGVAFRAHGKLLNPWYGRVLWMLITIFTLSVGRLLYYKCMGLRRIRREMAALRASFRQVGRGEPTDDRPGA